MAIRTIPQLCTWANTVACSQISKVEFFRVVIQFFCSINTQVESIDTQLEAIGEQLGAVVDEGGWIVESTIGEDLTSGAVQMIGTPGAGNRIEIRYLSYGNSSATPGVLALLNDGDNFYPNWTVQGSIWATRFNKGDYLQLAENTALLLSSDGDLIDAATASWEYRIVPV